MNEQTFDFIQELIKLTNMIGELKGELNAVKEENKYLRELLKKDIDSTESA